jgi:hypothetical protein
MICIEEKQNAGFYLWNDNGGKVPIDIRQLSPAVIQRFHSLKSQDVGARIEGCGSRLMSNVFVIYEDTDYGMNSN